MKTIGVLTPSGAVDEKALAGGIAYWKNKGYQVLDAQTRLVPDSYVDLDEEKIVKFNRMIEMLEDLDDVQEVYHNVNLPDEE